MTVSENPNIEKYISHAINESCCELWCYPIEKLRSLYSIDVGILGYIILYGLTLFNISPEELLQSEVPEKDIVVIRRVRIGLWWIFTKAKYVPTYFNN